MKRLEFPIIKGSAPAARHLSMDDYLEFVNFNLRHTVDVKECRKLKKASAVNAPFTMNRRRQ